MLEQHVHYITEPLKGLIFTLSADSGLPNIFSLNPQETKWLSVRDKIINGNLEILFMHRNTPIWWFCFIIGLITYQYKTVLFYFNVTHV